MFSHFNFHFQKRWYNPSFTVQSNLGPSMYGMHRKTSFFPVCPSCEMDWSLLPTMKLGQGNIFRSVCQEFCPQGGLQAHTQGEGWGVWLGGSPGPHPHLGGSPGPHLRGWVYPSMQWGRPPTHPADSYCCGGTHPTGMHSCFYMRFSLSMHITSVGLWTTGQKLISHWCLPHQLAYMFLLNLNLSDYCFCNKKLLLSPA